MCRIKISRKSVVQTGFILLLFLFVLLGAVSQRRSIGQSYQRIFFNGSEIGCVNNEVDVMRLLHQEKRNLALQSDEPVRMSYELTVETGREWFVPLATEAEISALLQEKLQEALISAGTRSYTVAIEGYRGNFSGLDEVISFLGAVKAEADPDQIFIPEISKENGHIAGILTANLTETNPTESTEVIPEKSVANEPVSGVSAAMMYQVEYALANAAAAEPGEEVYETGLLAMEFMEKIEVYEHAVQPEELSDIQEEVAEVTKEKETNKIYVVESGDCLSVIALDHETTVASIVALNGLDGAEVVIRPGDELILAVPEPDLRLRIQTGVVYEEDYNADPVIIENDSWYTTTQVVHQEGTVGHRERNDIVTYENGIEVGREMLHQNIMIESVPAVIEQGTITPPTYIKPLAGGIKTSNYGYRWGRLHKGVDYACPVGTTLYASSAGTVLSASYSSSYGYNVLISHPDGKMTRYAHCSKLLVSEGQYVEQGETIALSGNTGRSTGPHVHFEIYVDGVAVDPLKYISN